MDPIDKVIKQYYADVSWLTSLITDPTGSRYFLNKSRDTRMTEFHEQIDRINNFLAYANHPEKQFKSIHVAGTSGKGSVVTMIAAILHACGLRTGYHISPYLQLCNEKLVVNGVMIKPSDFSRLVNEFRSIYTEWKISGGIFDSLKYGEAWVALTYYWFAQQRLDWAVVETGLGGRYDPTNVIPSSQSVITNIDYDHVESLGPTLTDIAHHKAGIIKPGQNVITTETQQIILDILNSEASEKGATLFSLGSDFHLEVQSLNTGGAIIDVKTPINTYRSVHLDMPGTFQPRNAALAIMSVELLAHDQGFEFDIEAINMGFNELTFPGRFEIVRSNPLVILDGAHNPDKMKALVDSLQALYPTKRKFAVMGALITKDIRPMVTVLAQIVDGFYITQPHVFGKPSRSVVELADDVQEIAPALPIHVHENVHEAVENALDHMDNDDLLVVTGSLYLVGEARELWFPSDQLLKDLEHSK